MIQFLLFLDFSFLSYLLSNLLNISHKFTNLIFLIAFVFFLFIFYDLLEEINHNSEKVRIKTMFILISFIIISLGLYKIIV